MPSGHFTLFIPPSPFKVFGPWFFSRMIYFTPFCKQNKKRNVYCVTFIHTCESSMNEICHLPIFIRIKIFVLCASRKILRASTSDSFVRYSYGKTSLYCSIQATSLVFWVVYCRSLWLSFFFWPLCCLSYDIQILITPLVSSNSSYQNTISIT